MNTYSPLGSSFQTGVTLQTCRYSFAISKANVQIKSILPVQTFAATSLHVTSTVSNHSHISCVLKARRKTDSGNVVSHELSFYRTGSCKGISLNTTILISLYQVSIVTYPLYFIKLHFSSPLSFISHTSLIITIFTVGLYI